jgi:hypothetical protein
MSTTSLSCCRSKHTMEVYMISFVQSQLSFPSPADLRRFERQNYLVLIRARAT